MPLFGERPNGQETPGWHSPSGLESGFTLAVPANYGTDGAKPKYRWWRPRIDIRSTTTPHRLTSSDVKAPKPRVFNLRQTPLNQNPQNTGGVSFTPPTTTTLPTPLFASGGS